MQLAPFLGAKSLPTYADDILLPRKGASKEQARVHSSHAFGEDGKDEVIRPPKAKSRSVERGRRG